LYPICASAPVWIGGLRWVASQDSPVLLVAVTTVLR
jgi:hypothetical protein